MHTDHSIATLGVMLLASAIAGCATTMPSPPSDIDAKVAFENLKADDLAIRSQIETQSALCQVRLNKLVAKAKAERASSAAFAIVGAAGGLTSATLSASLSDQTAKTATAISAGGFALIAAGAKLIGDPDAVIKMYEATLAHYQKAASIADDLRLGIDYSSGDECLPPQHDGSLGSKPGGVATNLAKAKKPTLLPGQRWNELVGEMLGELRLCASDAPSSEKK